jgi:hypothetical protein
MKSNRHAHTLELSMSVGGATVVVVLPGMKQHHDRSDDC